jgi:hypothetical protein
MVPVALAFVVVGCGQPGGGSHPSASASQSAPQCFTEAAPFARALIDAASTNDAAAWNALQSSRFRLPPGQPDEPWGRFQVWRKELLQHEGALRRGPAQLKGYPGNEYLVVESLEMVVTHEGGCLRLDDN